jgi:excisionase family DNA binding protein
MLTTDELAELLQVSRRCVERWDAAGKVPGKVRLPGRLIRWRREVIEKWLAEGCPAPRPQRGR